MMMLIYLSFPVVLYIVGIISFVLNRKHLLSMLLILEYIVICLFFMVCIFLLYMNYEIYFSMLFLSFSVCEGALGLSILVSLVRTHGNDYFQSFNIL
uniref:NADH-ubiquinone oxidoreductase chain 4L n=1 Tax=Liriomyza huidobrensis TaxID=127405 RepID=R4HJ53_LIRHU|nr:ND4L gene product [Liriomyza huidobrensis]AEO51719.1 NADH dehydrogenase subunit 4L [Liriomyza huidobrensis]AFL93369.1 NADH dehydrogenase subunit 4L [Liriomyza huidobrensis]